MKNQLKKCVKFDVCQAIFKSYVNSDELKVRVLLKVHQDSRVLLALSLSDRTNDTFCNF